MTASEPSKFLGVPDGRGSVVISDHEPARKHVTSTAESTLPKKEAPGRTRRENTRDVLGAAGGRTGAQAPAGAQLSA